MPAPFRLGFLSHLHGGPNPRRLYRDYVELFVAAEELGFDSVWVAQHHFDSSSGGLPSPFPFLAAVAERTSRSGLARPWLRAALELLAAQVAPALGWRPRRPDGPVPADYPAGAAT
ncbi:LLM class flavin-dependent oxidoreductase [Trebonia sp.]|uniref:LLM class flavin-dependent oxidoreductase n=1 Tax=Trebonia sp. TaxID=2767075 RepID=UPI00261D49AF|nr:LLM class flavin-dependent oxidoreductase [Trebonia sp.]